MNTSLEIGLENESTVWTFEVQDTLKLTIYAPDMGDDYPWYYFFLTRKLAAALAPVLQHYADTGELPPPKE